MPICVLLHLADIIDLIFNVIRIIITYKRHVIMQMHLFKGICDYQIINLYFMEGSILRFFHHN